MAYSQKNTRYLGNSSAAHPQLLKRQPRSWQTHSCATKTFLWQNLPKWVLLLLSNVGSEAVLEAMRHRPWHQRCKLPPYSLIQHLQLWRSIHRLHIQSFPISAVSGSPSFPAPSPLSSSSAFTPHCFPIIFRSSPCNRLSRVQDVTSIHLALSPRRNELDTASHRKDKPGPGMVKGLKNSEIVGSGIRRGVESCQTVSADFSWFPEISKHHQRSRPLKPYLTSAEGLPQRTTSNCIRWSHSDTRPISKVAAEGLSSNCTTRTTRTTCVYNVCSECNISCMFKIL